ncbi:MAG: nrdD protein [Desulfovibrio sp.]|nr:nrdD protein [Desulfovibrio sp.]
MIIPPRIKKSVVNGKTIIGEGVGFERVRRITGYLVGTLERFNNAKRAEESDRVKHDMEDEK